MKKLLLSCLVLFMCSVANADLVEFTDKTIELGLNDTTYASVYFGKGWSGYSVIVSVKPYSDDIYKKWVKWTSEGKQVGTNANFVSTVDMVTGSLTFDRDSCGVVMYPGNNRYPGWIQIRCSGVDETEWVRAKEDFQLYKDLTGGWVKKYPAYEYYTKK